MLVWFWISKILRGRKQWHYFAISGNQDLLVCCFSSCIRSCWRLPLTNPALSASRDFGFWCGNGPEGMGPGAPNAALQHLNINIFVRDFFALILQHVKTKVHCLSILLKYFGPSLVRLGQTLGTCLSLFSQPSERQHQHHSAWNYFRCSWDWNKSFT